MINELTTAIVELVSGFKLQSFWLWLSDFVDNNEDHSVYLNWLARG